MLIAVSTVICASLGQDMLSSEEKMEYRLDERTADLSDLVDNTSTRLMRLEQQQQQQQILSMEMVENATFRTIMSKLINVVLSLLAVVLVAVSSISRAVAPFVHSGVRLGVTTGVAIFGWLLYHNWDFVQGVGQAVSRTLSWTKTGDAT